MKILAVGNIETFAGGTMSLINLCYSLQKYEKITIEVFGLVTDESDGFHRIQKELTALKIILKKEPVFHWIKPKNKILRKANRIISLILNIYNLIKYIKSKKIDIVHTYDSYVNPIGTIAAKLAGVKLVYTAHLESDIGQQNNLWRAKSVLNQADAIITTCKKFIEAGIQNGLDLKKMINIYTGVRGFDNYQEENSLNFTEYRLNHIKEKPIIVLIGRMDQQKGHQIIIEAVRQSPEFYANTEILFVGDINVNIEYVNQLRIKIEEYNINNIIKITGIASSIKQLLCLADVVVLPSLYESVPMILLEAMQAGKPIVASKVGGIPEIVIDGVTGFTFELNELHTLTSKINTILCDPLVAQKFEREGRRLIDNQFSLDNMAKDHVKVYKKLIQNDFL